LTHETFALGATTGLGRGGDARDHGPRCPSRARCRRGRTHAHARGRDDTVLEGALVVDDGVRHELGHGEAHVLPRGVRHSFANESDSPARALFFCSPGGLERFFREVAGADTAAEAAAAAERAGLVID
jgi:mannose-6-phosphate isomerase-like protein (cupin superfamily)